MSYGNQRSNTGGYQRILIVFCVLVALLCEGVSAGQVNQVKKCAEINEYCQNHWDCCSNSCLSYLYRCVRSYNVYPYPFLGVTHIPTVTLEDILAQNFGPQNVKPAPAVAAAVPVAPAPVPAYKVPSFESRFNGDDNAIANNDDKEVKVDIVLQDQKPVLLETTTDVATTDAATTEPCKEIGSKCYNDNECCTNRCHGFLHKCVT
uniref:WAP domain-containing protein n=1 Tax=Musca domestica TaxID=7370 RepID=A0A1I8MV88_MUSDO